jgi:hypothetical protein
MRRNQTSTLNGKNCALCFWNTESTKVPVRKIPSCSTIFVVGFVKHSCIWRTCLPHIRFNVRWWQERHSCYIWTLNQGFLWDVSKLPSFFYFPSVNTWLRFVFFLYKMAITSRFAKTFVVGSMLSKCTLENYAILQTYSHCDWKQTERNCRSKILSATAQLQPDPCVSQIRFDKEIYSKHQQAFSVQTNHPADSVILTLDTRRMSAFPFMYRLHYNWGNFDNYWGGFRGYKKYGWRGKRGKSLVVARIDYLVASPPACCLNTTQLRTHDFFRGVGLFNKFSWGQRAERTGIWGR